jgi:hypothetical protein
MYATCLNHLTVVLIAQIYFMKTNVIKLPNDRHEAAVVAAVAVVNFIIIIINIMRKAAP